MLGSTSDDKDHLNDPTTETRGEMSHHTRRERSPHSHQRELIRVLVAQVMILVIISVFMSACPGGEPAAQIEGPCQSIGDRCRIRAGVLGVCSPAEGLKNPKTDRSMLICTPQH